MERIDIIIKELIKKCRTNNPREIAEKLNIRIIEFALNKEICGYYRYLRKNNFIVINNSLADTMKLFVIAHELGHAVLHPRVNTYFLRSYTLFPVDKIESEANEFATKLMLANAKVFEGTTKEMLCREYGIPYEMEKFI
ncbi:MAG: ImmA/IrrE family metallo-endopeptidase [Sporolactobacillus sp.]